MAVIESRIDSVTVYRMGATVVRRVELDAGEDGLPAQVEVGALPLSLLDPTTRVRVVDVEPKDAIVATTSVRVGMRAHTEASDANEGARDRLEDLERRQMLATAQLRQREIELQMLRSMEVPERPEVDDGKPPVASPISARVALERFSDEAIGERLEGIRALRRDLRQIEKEAAELRDVIQRASSAREAKPHQLYKTVIAQLAQHGARVRSAALLVEYQVPGACWAPAYKLDLGRDGGHADLGLRAVVAQRTGEDWCGVRIGLSTADVLTWSEKPEFTAIRIGRAQATERDRRGFRAPPRGAASLYSDYDAGRSAARQLLPPAPGWCAPVMHPVAPDLFGELEEQIDFGGDSKTPVGERTAQMLLSPMKLPGGAASFTDAEEVAESLDVMAPSAPPLRAPMPAAHNMARRRRPSTEVTRRVDTQIKEVSQQVSRTLLFSQLQLGSPDVRSARNRLMPRDARANYMETLKSDGVEVELDVMNVIYEARQRAEAVASLPIAELLPERDEHEAFDYRYDADALVDVDGDGQPHTIGLCSRAVESQVCYITVPRSERAVYRSARLENPLESPLLPGPVEVYVGGQYVLSADLPLVDSKGHFELGLGVEQGVKVARNTRYSERRSGEKVVAMTELDHQIELQLVNHLEREIRCEVRERVPQPATDAEVVVEEGEVEPPWEGYDQRERGEEIGGGRRWRVVLGAGEEKTLRANYVVKIYANNELVGGNRREA